MAKKTKAELEKEITGLKSDIEILREENDTLRKDLEVAEQEAEEGHDALLWQKAAAPSLRELETLLRDLRDYLWMVNVNKPLPEDVRNLFASVYDKLESPCNDITSMVKELDNG